MSVDIGKFRLYNFYRVIIIRFMQKINLTGGASAWKNIS